MSRRKFTSKFKTKVDVTPKTWTVSLIKKYCNEQEKNCPSARRVLIKIQDKRIFEALKKRHLLIE